MRSADRFLPAPSPIGDRRGWLMQAALLAVTDVHSARALVQLLSARLGAAGVAGFRAPPPEPTTCCGRGCNGCVWEGYFAALHWWREDALELLGSAQ